jgi:hypothetical protein
MSKYQEIEGTNDFARDNETGAVVNINRTEVQAARERKRLWKEDQAKRASLENDVNSLKKEMSEIKGLLSQIVEKL